MNVLRTIITEIIGLFVDDWAFAALIIIWVGVMSLIAPHLAPIASAALLFLGIAVVTLLFVARRARALR